jgi:hypothetical protein
MMDAQETLTDNAAMFYHNGEFRKADYLKFIFVMKK